MASGISIHVGVNAVNPQHYGALPILHGCEQDARAMAELAARAGFAVREPLLGQRATVASVTAAIEQGLADSHRGDLLLVTFAGHGGQLPDKDGDDGEDGFDETWCLYDRQLIDDELYALWTRANPGTRILVISDSCYSGNVIRDADDAFGQGPFGGGAFGEDDFGADTPRSFRDPYADAQRGGPGVRGVSPGAASSIFARNSAAYEAAKRGSAAQARVPLQASVLLLSASADWQPAREDKGRGVFTTALVEAWRNGAFTGAYRDFHAEIFGAVHRVAGDAQTPGYFWASSKDVEFFGQKPFFIDDATSRALGLHGHPQASASR